jgi:hypothetical protein
MNTLLITCQIVFYGIGIVSAFVNIASVVRAWRFTSMNTDAVENGAREFTRAPSDFNHGFAFHSNPKTSPRPAHFMVR